jgi:hypothetical protein
MNISLFSLRALSLLVLSFLAIPPFAEYLAVSSWLLGGGSTSFQLRSATVDLVREVLLTPFILMLLPALVTLTVAPFFFSLKEHGGRRSYTLCAH